ncbi:hypothetical protein TNCV_1534371 [Trichonephila clavipes]|nr:hypothetical protein TNCV_1534371 [Trichonephila clavipes]
MSMLKPLPVGVVWKLLRVRSNCAYTALTESILASQRWLWSRARDWARVLLPLKTRRVDEAIPPADVVVRKDGFQLRCPPRHSTKAQNYEVCDQ